MLSLGREVATTRSKTTVASLPLWRTEQFEILFFIRSRMREDCAPVHVLHYDLLQIADTVLRKTGVLPLCWLEAFGVT